MRTCYHYIAQPRYLVIRLNLYKERGDVITNRSTRSSSNSSKQVLIKSWSRCGLYQIFTIALQQIINETNCGRCFEGLTCMHVAAKFGAIPIIEILAEMGVSVKIRDSQGATPLHYVHDVVTCQVNILLQSMFGV